ncbi:hypothetical protein FPY71_10150 [Aureimonas fodinaquatilis]|uniref:ribonucleoside-diphosphate reductase n=1 Tax=Aureimonas fodinaquatilis TaxID=2565783 RepID=A0A5B0DWT8_9HYPH|nr:hypothetical protein [Aureimonas fodinaquatilis]KAA0970828.1 hypothetical protein FPY71_10150 [Aureimonas fodinaquatilis]
MSRKHLPNRRPAENCDIWFQGMEVQVSFGWTDDERITEVFASTRKVGTSVDTMVRDTAVLISISLQYGVTPPILERSLTMDETGQAEGFAGVILKMIREREAEVRSGVAA